MISNWFNSLLNLLNLLSLGDFGLVRCAFEYSGRFYEWLNLLQNLQYTIKELKETYEMMCKRLRIRDGAGKSNSCYIFSSIQLTITH